MLRFSQRQRRRWSLPLVVVLLLHWTFGVCEAMAQVLCFEPSGQTVLEVAGEPCKTAAMEYEAGKPCFDLPAEPGDEHVSVPPYPPLLADVPPAFIPSIAYVLADPRGISLALPRATGPPVSTDPVVLRKTTVLLI